MTKPAIRIELDGVDVTKKWGTVLSSLTVTDEAGSLADTCEIVFDNAEKFTAPPKDAQVKLWLGYEPTPVYVGGYKVVGWTKKGPVRELTVRTQSAELTTAIKATKLRSFHDKTLGDIVSQIAGEHGLDVRVDADLASRQIAHIDQQTESDLAFLTRLAKRNGAIFKLADGKLIFTKKGSATAPSGKAKSAIVLQPTDISDWEATSGERGNYKSVVCCYMDGNTGRRVQVTAGSGKPCHRDRRLYGSRAEADAAARGALGDFERGAMSVSINMPGMPEMYAEALVEPKDFDPDVDGQFMAKSVTHTFSRDGFITSVTLEKKA